MEKKMSEVKLISITHLINDDLKNSFQTYTRQLFMNKLRQLIDNGDYSKLFKERNQWYYDTLDNEFVLRSVVDQWEDLIKLTATNPDLREESDRYERLNKFTTEHFEEVPDLIEILYGVEKAKLE